MEPNNDVHSPDNIEHEISKEINKQKKPQRIISHSMRVAMIDKKKHFISVLVMISVVGIFSVVLASKSSEYITFGKDFFANKDQEEAIEEQIDNGYTFAFGTEPTDTTDYSSFSIQPAPQDTREEFINTINNSPAFEDVDSIYEIIDYDQFDKDGNISEQAMLDVINTGKAIEE